MIAARGLLVGLAVTGCAADPVDRVWQRMAEANPPAETSVLVVWPALDRPCDLSPTATPVLAGVRRQGARGGCAPRSGSAVAWLGVGAEQTGAERMLTRGYQTALVAPAAWLEGSPDARRGMQYVRTGPVGDALRDMMRHALQPDRPLLLAVVLDEAPVAAADATTGTVLYALGSYGWTTWGLRVVVVGEADGSADAPGIGWRVSPLGEVAALDLGEASAADLTAAWSVPLDRSER